ncbi:hypothetical protein MPTK1_2g04640 [Marchantia polymorpha subsp. ruderalis]
MIGNAVYSLKCASRIYDFCVTFLKISEINVPLQSRSFPSAGSPAGSGRLAKRCLKLTALYGTGQREIGEFEVVGDECVIDHQLNYQVYPSDSATVTKLHVYVDEACSYGLTGHVTVDLKEFIGEHDSEVYLEYPLTPSSPRHRAAKLKIVVRCTFPPPEEDPDLDLETFLSDSFPHSDSHRIPEESEVKHLLPGSEFGSTQINPDEIRRQENGTLDQTLYQAKTLCIQSKSEIHLLKDLEGDLLGLNSKLQKFVAEYARSKSVFGQYRRERDSTPLSKSDLQAAIFFAAGVTMQQRLYALQAASVCSQPLVEKHGAPFTKNSLILLRSKTEDCDVLPVIGPSPEKDLAEVVTFTEENLLGLKTEPHSESSSSSSYSSGAESVESSTEKAHGRNHGHASTSSNCNNCVVCSACSTPDSHGIESFPNSPYCEETRPLNGARSRSTSGEREDVKVSNPTPKRSVTAVIRNVLGVLLIAGVSFMLGAKVGSLGFKRERTPTGSENWADIKQMEAWKETVISGMRNPNDLMGGLQSRRSAQYQPAQNPLLPDKKFSPPDQFLDINLRNKIALRSDCDEQTGTDSPVTTETEYPSDRTAKDKGSKGYSNLVAREYPLGNLNAQVVPVELRGLVAPNEPRSFESNEQRGGSRTTVEGYGGNESQEEVLRWRKMLRGTKAGLREDTGAKN